MKKLKFSIEIKAPREKVWYCKIKASGWSEKPLAFKLAFPYTDGAFWEFGYTRRGTQEAEEAGLLNL